MIETVRGKRKRLSRREIDEKFSIRPYQDDEEVLAATAADGAPRVQVSAGPAPVVVLGKGSEPARELRLEPCLADGVPLQRRRGGGCAVVLDPGCVLVTATRSVPGIGNNQQHFDELTAWMVAGLDTIGFPNIKGDGISDLVLQDRKVAGTCLYRRKGLLLYSASILVDPDLDGMERYLAHPPREPDYRRGRDHRSFCRGLRPGGGAEAAMEVVARLTEELVVAR